MRAGLFALLLGLGACETPPRAAADGAPADAPLGPCAAPDAAPDAAPAPPPDPAARGEPVWSYVDPVLSFLAAQPALGPDGTVYVVAGTRLFALDPATGRPRWKAASAEGEPFVPVPLVDEAGRVLVASSQIALYAFAAGDGALLYRRQLTGPPQNGGAVTPPVRLPGGFALAAGARVFWLDACGQPQGEIDHPERLEGPLIATPDGLVVTGEPKGGALVALLPGRLAWRAVLGAPPGDLLARADGAVVATTGGAGIVALVDGHTGAVRAQVSRDGRVGGPILLGDGTLIVAETPAGAPLLGRVAALDPDSLLERWRVDLPGQIALLPVATTAGILLGLSDGAVDSIALVRPDPGGGASLVFATPCAGCTFVGPPAALAPDGTAYAAALTHVAALATPGALDPGSAWPRARGADDRNTARTRLPTGR